ncbi:MAG: PP2C family protein-serine/threonine phosphatase [Spirochaetales bacterium]|nr:PP2C family protein-serine/threonine phosphatase [Spirochaetales bacterium]
MSIGRKLRSNMAFNIIGGIVLVITLFAFVVGAIGFVSFTNSFKKEYSTTTYHMADTATSLVNGDHLFDYLTGLEMEEYQRTKRYLENYCKRMAVSIVYVIMVEQNGFDYFFSIFNCVNNEVDNTSYVPWELGHRRQTTNEDYRQEYIKLYNKQAPYGTIYRINTKDGNNWHITTLVPIMDSNDDVAGLLCIQRPINEIYKARIPYLITIVISTIVLVFLASAFAVFFMKKQLIGPIRKVSFEATRFAQENKKGEELGDISSFEELANLAKSIDTMETDMENYMENLTVITAEKERIGTELALASDIQTGSIPNTFPAFPDRTDFDIFASMDPAKEVGGDFYNFFLVDNDHLAMVIGDVSGKGVPAALFMMVSNILTSVRTQTGGNPAQILEFVNDKICESNKLDMFVTIWLGILELSTGKLIASNAGHEYPAVMHAGGNFELFKDKHGIVVGGMDGVRYTDYEIQLSPGDKIFVYTDGVPEATDGDNNMFGVDRMLSALNLELDAGPEKVLGNVRSAVDAFVKDAQQFDDLTMLCMQYKG